MKTLQNNFTTIAQSKRLLELGVPILTADCYYYVHEVNGKNICNTPCVIPFGMGEYGLKHWWADKYNDRYFPCWSTGRLMEIYCILRDVKCIFSLDTTDIIDNIIACFERNKLDFSKLEE